MAAETKLIHPIQEVTLIHSRDQLVSSEPLPSEFKDRVLQTLQEEGVKVVLGKRVVDTQAIEHDGRVVKKVTLSDGSIMYASIVIDAVSRGVPSTSFLPQYALDVEGYVQVDE